MKNYLVIGLVMVFTVISCKPSVKSVTEPEKGLKPLKTVSVDLEETRELITYLASDELKGREPGTPEYQLTTNYIEQFFTNNNIQPYYDTYKDACMVNGVESNNILGFVGDKTKDRPIVIISAHLDHIGTSNSAEDSVYNGANDNASGVTAVLQLAKELNKHQLNKNIVFALFTGEESGLIGSTHLANRMKQEGVTIAYMYNIEMIGTVLSTGENQVYMTGYHKSNMPTAINSILGKDFVRYLPAAKTYGLFNRSDNAPFYNVFNIPAHTISSFDFKNFDFYHKEDDEVAELDIENMNAIIETSAQAILALLENEIAIQLK